ncbi:MAG: hypothetical protein EBS65_24815, partial [Betaproteobacteria bacterium]|nr:hypothetical protein [Betaproteobacteria bacterium]
GVLDAATAKRRQLPVLLVIGGTHAGEIDGKDAGLILMRELLTDKGIPAKYKDYLRSIGWPLVPFQDEPK